MNRPRLRPVAWAAMAVVVAAGSVVRIQAALDPSAAGPARSRVEALRPAGDLDGAPPPPSVGVDGPARGLEDQPDGAATRRTWFAAGRWWSVLAGGPDGGLHIWALAGAAGPWVDTGLVVDDRPFAQPWVEWHGGVLLVTTTGDRSYRSHGLRVARYTWDSAGQAWARAADFPVQVTEAGVPGTQAAVDATGRLWLARLDDGRLLVAHSDVQNLAFTAFAPLPDGLAATDVGAFALRVDATGLHLVWRSASTDRLTVADGDGEAWSATTHTIYGASGTGPIDAAPAGPDRPGELLVVVTTSLAARGSNDQDPSLIVVAVRYGDAVTSVAAVAADQLRSPRLVVDADAGRVHLVAVADPVDPATGSSTVVDKVADRSDLAFASGTGSVLLRTPAAGFATATVPASIETATGLLVVASGNDLRSWRTAQVGGPTRATATEATPDATMVHDTFDQRPLGGPAPSGWYADDDRPLTASIVAGAAGGRALSVTDADGIGPPSACRAVPRTASARVVVRARLRPTALGTADVRLLTVKGDAGSLASIRVTRKGLLGYSSPGGRVDQGPLPVGATLQATIVIDREQRTAELAVAVDGGATLFTVGAQPLLSDPGAGPDEVCFAPPPGNPAAGLVLDDLLITAG